ncbi:MAG: UDP-N-acetylmuramate--L-alanine ligase [Phycisphaeraceae bacterium]|nr:UDP-N-acetylmuramate--L-alanine ligase [Phycisphaeraceae bacterium]
MSTPTPTSHAASGGDSAVLAGRRIHFVGIGGCGMSGLARIARQLGAACTGSDSSDGDTVRRLTTDGIDVALNQTAASVPQACDMLVASAAIRMDHPEVAEARRRGVEVVKYAQMLGRLMDQHTGIAIAGTHGKSTTTSMTSHVLIQAGLDPSFIVGATCAQIGGGCRAGRSNLLVAEACEFDRSFHNYHPRHAAILNVEEDHLDVYASLDEIVESFAVFARQIHSDGSLLINHEMPHRLAITAGLRCEVETIGFAPQADWQVELVHTGDAPPTVCLKHHGQTMCGWTNLMPGEHMAYNAAAAAVLCHRAGAAWRDIAAALGQFRGLDRRMQLLGQRQFPGGAVTVIDDYGHHPTEIDTTLRALRRHYHPGRLICVFQPHQHSRTRFLMEQFAASFSVADVIVVPHIYFVRDSEKERHSVSAADLVDRLRQRGQHAMHLYPFEAIVEQLELIARPGDLLVTMGAGDVWKVAQQFLSQGK